MLKRMDRLASPACHLHRLAGVLFVTRPGFGGIHWAVSFSLLATLSSALYILWTRYLARFDDARTTLVYTPLAGALFVAPLALESWPTPKRVWVWLVLLSTGLFDGFGHWLVILAQEHAPAPILAPFGYTSIIYMIALGLIVFGDVPSLWTLAGASDHHNVGSVPALSGTSGTRSRAGSFLRNRCRRIGFADAGREVGKIAFADRLADSRHEILVESDICPAQDHWREIFASPNQVVNVGAGVVAGRGACARFVEGAMILDMRGIAHVELAAPGKSLTVAAGPCRHHAIEHVDAAFDRADDVGGRADAHEVAWFVGGEERRCRGERLEHELLAFADS